MAFVNHFGAAGDGQRDDTEALEHALAGGDGVLELGKGSYRITRPIVIDTTRTGYAAVRGLGAVLALEHQAVPELVAADHDRRQALVAAAAFAVARER